MRTPSHMTCIPPGQTYANSSSFQLTSQAESGKADRFMYNTVYLDIHVDLYSCSKQRVI